MTALNVFRYIYIYSGNVKGQKQLFAEQGEEEWVQKDCITDDFWQVLCSRFGNSANISKEDIFYYVYALLHSVDYRKRFAKDLAKTSPARIPIVDSAQKFMAFSQAGRALADLHLNYENFPAPEVVKVREKAQPAEIEMKYAYYSVEKMAFVDKDKHSIKYNENITIENIPQEAYDYKVNGKSAIEWIMDSYKTKTDKDSGIPKDPNLWAREHNKPRYILDLLISIIHMSIETQKIVNNLPKLDFPAH